MLMVVTLVGCGDSEEEQARKRIIEIDERLAELAQQAESIRLEQQRLNTEKAELGAGVSLEDRADSAASSATATRDQPDDGAPTEAEMRQAFEDRIAAINANLERQANMAKNRTYDKNDPMSALQALGGLIVGDGRFVVTGFTKIGATRAVGRSGYHGEFVVEMTIEGDGSFAKSQGPFLAQYSGGQIIHGRFYEYNGQWIYEPAED